MQNVFISSSVVTSGSLVKGGAGFGVVEQNYGPTTANTGFYNTIIPPANGYVFYQTKAQNGPIIKVANTDAELINYVRLASGITYSISGALQWAATQNNVAVANIDYSNVVTNGLFAILDASSTLNYPRTGSTIYDISGQNASGSLNGSVIWVNSGSQSYFNFAVGSNSNYISSTLSQSYFDCTIVLMPDFSYSSPTGLAGLIATSTPTTNSDKSLRIAGVNGTGPWSMASRNPGDGNDWANPSATTYYVNGTASNVLVSGWNVFGGYRTNTTGFPSTFPYFIGSGGFAGDNRGFQGKIAVVLLYNRQLSAAEQLTNYNALKGRFGLS
jgi:hypothetical protein